MAATKNVIDCVAAQRDGCAQLGSPLYAGLLGRLREDVESGGPGWKVLEPFADWSPGSAYVLRVMGAVNRLVLTGEAPDLAPHFVPGGVADHAWPAFISLLAERHADVREIALARPVQTNEVGRAAVLAPAILTATRGRPTRLLELGASAGLNLRWDAFRYEDVWGDPASPVQLVDRYDGAPPPFDQARIEVLERRGCDASPIDPSTEEGRLTLLSYVWPDQKERLSLLRGAIDVAGRIPATVDRAGAADWLEQTLEEPPPPGSATVVYHSIFWQYLPEDERARIRSLLAAAGARATESEPLAWISLEAEREMSRLDATLWPGGKSRLLARAGYHGRPVRWEAKPKRGNDWEAKPERRNDRDAMPERRSDRDAMPERESDREAKPERENDQGGER
jgi:hypothetical protein